MYRLVRRFRARVKTREMFLILTVLVFALAFGRGAGVWYQSSGRDNWLVASVNKMGGVVIAAPISDVETSNYEERAAYDFFAAVSDDVASGFFASPRASHLQPTNVYTASLLALSGQDGAGSSGSSGAAGLWSSENSGSSGDSGDSSGQWEAPDAVDHSIDANSEIDGAAEQHADYNADNDTNRDAAEPGDKPADIPSDQPVYTVKVIYFGDRHVFQTTGKKVSELFEEHGIFVTKDDKITGAYLDGTINSDLYIEVKRVTTKTIVEEVKIPAKTVYRDNAELSGNQSKTIRNAVDGLKRIEYLLTYENGIQVSKNAIKEETITEAVSGIVEQGTTGRRKGKGGVEFTYSKVIDVKCTAYNSGFESTGKQPSDPDYGITKTGMEAREGVVAVDPSVIPLYTKMYIEILDEGIEDYGFAVAGDIGGKITGKKVDLYFDKSQAELLKFGVRKARVYILD